MRAGFFGGTFDPPHCGHLAVAQAAAEKFSLDTIFFAPAGNQPLKPGGAHASFADRLAMVELLCAAPGGNPGKGRFVTSIVDAPREDGQPNYTIDTLHRLRAGLKEQSPDCGVELFVIVGADSFLDLRRWKEPEALLHSAQWIVVSRPGSSLDDLAPLSLTSEERESVHLLEDVSEPASATEIRERLQAGLDCSALLTPEVYRYIREHRLYSARTIGGEV